MLAALSTLQQWPYVHLFELFILICNNSLRLKAFFSLQATALEAKNVVSKDSLFSLLWRIKYLLLAFRNTTEHRQFSPCWAGMEIFKSIVLGHVWCRKVMALYFGVSGDIFLHPPNCVAHACFLAHYVFGFQLISNLFEKCQANAGTPRRNKILVSRPISNFISTSFGSNYNPNFKI
jgi:hypothetical protein